MNIKANKFTNKSKLPLALMERKGYKFRLKIPNSNIHKLLQAVGSCRFVWNTALALIKADDNNYNTALANIQNSNNVLVDQNINNNQTADNLNINTQAQPIREFKFNPYYQLSKLLPHWKANTKTSFLKNTYSKSLQITLEELSKALTEAKSKTNPKRYPVFKKRGLKDSFSFNGTITHDSSNSRIYIPKIGYLHYHKSREALGAIKNVTIGKKDQHWYVSMQTEKSLTLAQNTLNHVAHQSNTLAIDVGITKAYSLSSNIAFEYQGKIINTNQIDSISPLKNNRAKLTYLQRNLTNKQKFSNNWRKQQYRISKLHTKIANIRNDFTHKVTSAIVKHYPHVVIEDLQITNMSKSAKGSILQHGKKVKQKSGLNRSILDQAWGKFKEYLNYKLHYNHQTALIQVKPQYTSQQCSKCKYIHKDNRKSQALFTCIECSFTLNADINAAYNIKEAGLALLACGVSTIEDNIATLNDNTFNVANISRYDMSKQEPTEQPIEISCGVV